MNSASSNGMVRYLERSTTPSAPTCARLGRPPYSPGRALSRAPLVIHEMLKLGSLSRIYRRIQFRPQFQHRIVDLIGREVEQYKPVELEIAKIQRRLEESVRPWSAELQDELRESLRQLMQHLGQLDSDGGWGATELRRTRCHPTREHKGGQFRVPPIVRTSQRTGNARLARMRAKSGCSWLMRTLHSTRVTTEGTIRTGVRRSSYHRSPKARAVSNERESHCGTSSSVISSRDKPAGIWIHNAPA